MGELRIDPRETSWVDVYRRLTQVVVPRPIALVSSVDAAGNPNLAPFSYFTVISGNPPLLAFSPLRSGRTGERKDTLRNVEATGGFVVAAVTAAMAEAVNRCSASLPHGDSEFAHSGLTPVPAERVTAPRVAESPVNLECELVEVRTYGEEGGAGNLVVGRVVLLHVADDVLDEDGLVDPGRLQPVGRMGSDLWVRAWGTFAMPRPK